MTYLYGDSSPFPEPYNFIDLLRDLTDVCVALQRVEQLSTEEQRRRELAKLRMEQELTRIKGISGSVFQALGPYLEGTDARVTEVAVRMRDAIRNIVQAASDEVSHRPDASLRGPGPTSQEERTRVRKAIERFLIRHELSGTAWHLSWDASGPVALARASATTTLGLEATLDLDAASSPWAKPVKVGDLEPSFALSLPRKGDVGKERRVELDRHYITAAKLGPERLSFLLSRHPGRGGEVEFEITSWTGELAKTTVQRMDKRGGPTGDAIEVRLGDALPMQRLLDRVRAGLGALVAKRTGLVNATFEANPVETLSKSGELAQRLVAAVQGVVQEIRRRSLARDELVLKRDLGNGRREEIYITRAELIAKVSDLAAPYRKLFEAFGLTEEEMTAKAQAEVEQTPEAKAAPEVQEVVPPPVVLSPPPPRVVPPPLPPPPAEPRTPEVTNGTSKPSHA